MNENHNCRNCWWLQHCPLCKKYHCGELQHEVENPDEEWCDGWEVND